MGGDHDKAARLAAEAKTARQDYAELAAVVKRMSDPTPELICELDVLRKKAEAASSARDEAKPRSQRVRELRGKHEEVQAKLDKNCDRLRQQEALVAKLKADLGKAEAAQEELVTIIENQQQKVRELHTMLGSMFDSESEEDSEDDEGMEQEGRDGERVRGVVGKSGKVTHTTDEARLASLLAVRAGTGAASLLRDERRAWADIGATDGDKERRRDDRSRSPPQ
jgi:DNA repair exonuclease SbcCD ATPase subunit